MKLSILAGSTSQTVNIFIQDSSSTVGAGLAGLVYNSGSLTCYYALPKAASASVSLVTLAAVTSAWSSGGFKEIDATNMAGWYRLDLPNAVLASGRFVSVHLKGATNMAPCPIEIELTGWDNQDAVHGGMSALPNAAAAASGGLPTIGVTIPNATAGASGGLLISGSNAGTTTLGALTITGATTYTGATAYTGAVTMAAGLAITQSTTNGDAVKVTGNGTGAGLSINAGATGPGLEIFTTAGDGVLIQPTAGNAIVATANGTSKHGLVVTGGTAGTSDGIKAVAGSGGVDIRGAITGNITGNLSGSAGSVTGAVGSVTGTVGSVTGAVGSVTGSVASVTGSVGSVTGAVGSVTGAVGSVTADVGITQGAADKVWGTTTRILTAGTNIALAKGTGVTGFNDITAASVWGVARSGNQTSLTFGEYVDAAISTRSTFAGGAVASVTGAVGSVTGNVGGNVTGSVGSVTGAVGSVTGAVGSVTGAVGSVTADVGITQAGADKVWGTTARVLTAGTNIALAKGTGVTGFNDITAANVWGVTRTGNRSSGTFGEAIPDAAAAAAGGLLISGSNAGTTTLGALTITGVTTHTGATVHTGAVTMAAGLAITQSSTNADALIVTGNGTGAGLSINAGATGPGLEIFTTAGDGVLIQPTAGNAIVATANGTSKHGLLVTGGTAGTSDGLKAVAGTGGVPIRGDLTANITGNLSGSVGSVTGAVGSVTGAVASVTGNVGGSVGSVIGAVGSVTGSVGSVTGSVGSVTGAVGSVTGDVGITQVGADKVWGTTTRVLTAGTNIALAKGTGLTGLNDITAASVWGVARSGNQTASTFGEYVDAAISTRSTFSGGAVASVTGAVGSVTGNVGGNVTGSVGSVTGAVGSVTGAVGSVTADVGITQAGADKVWGTTARILTAGTNIALAKGTGVTGFNDIAAASVWGVARSGNQTASTFGEYFDAAISTRSTFSGGAVASVTGAVGSVTGAVGSVTADVGITQASADKVWGTTTRVLTAGTNIELAKGTGVTGFNDITSASVWGVTRTGNQTAGTFGEYFDAAISTRSTFAGGAVSSVTGAVGSVTGSVGGNVTGSVGSVTGSVASVTGNVGGNVVGSVGTVTTVSDKTGYALSSAGIDSIVIETGVNARQSLSGILSACTGVVSGADSTTVTMKGGNVATTRIVATVDTYGNRSAVTLTLPS